MDRKLLDLLVCPATRQPLALLERKVLDTLNAGIARGEIRRDDGQPQADALTAALITRDGKRVYRIDDGIPVLLVEDALLVAGIDGIAA